MGSEEYPRYERPAPVTQPVVRVERPKQTLEQWAVDVCKVRDCYDGFVSREIDGYSTLFACPVCERWKTDMSHRTIIPSAKRWMGKVDLYTPQQMLEIVNRRQAHVQTMRRGTARMPDVQIEMIGEGPF